MAETNLVNKVVFGSDTLIDLTEDTVNETVLADGYTAHDAAGLQVTGKLVVPTELQIMQKVYPVGAIYISTANTNPKDLFGFGSWEQIKDRFLLSAGDSYSAGSSGGTEKHTHKYGLQYGGYYRSTSIEANPNAGLVNYAADGTKTIVGGKSAGSIEAPINSAVTTTIVTRSMTHELSEANVEHISNIPPYLSVYVWKRTE